MADHVWSIEAEHFGYLCSMVLKPETGAYSCFAGVVPVDVRDGELVTTLGSISLESNGSLT